MEKSETKTAPTVAVVSEAVTLDAPGFDSLRKSGVLVKRVPASTPTPERLSLLEGCFGIVAGTEPYPHELLTKLPELRIIARSGVGYDAIDVTAAGKLGIEVTVTSGINATGVAEHSLAMLLALMHRTRAYDDRVRSGEWRDGLFFQELHGATIGIVGLGRIGRCFAELLQPFGGTVLAFDPIAPAESTPASVIRVRSMDELLPMCEVLSLHIPLTGETRGLIGAREIARLPRGAIIVNTSRGGILDEDSLIDALDKGHLGGAALDVFSVEPPARHSSLFASDNLLLSPHIASFGTRTIARMSEMIADQLQTVLRGRTPEGRVSVDP